MSITKRIIGGTSVITLGGISARLITFITLPILTQLLGPEPYGALALVSTGVSLGAVIAMLGIDMAYARFYLQEASDLREDVELFCWRFSAVGAAIIAVLQATIWYFIGDRWAPNDHKVIALYSFFALSLTVAVAMATTRARLSGKYLKIAISFFVSAAVGASISVLLASIWRQNISVLLIGAMSSLLITLLTIGVPKPKFFIKKSKLNVSKKLEVIKLGLAGSITAPMYWLISSSDKWFIAEYFDRTQVGIYSVAVSVAVVGLMLNSSLTLTWFPEASKLYANRLDAAVPALARLWERLIVLLALVWVFITAVGSEVLTLLTTREFHSGSMIIPWIAGGVFFYGLAGMSNTAFFLKNRMQIVAIVWIFGAVLNLLLNFWLVSSYGFYGAAISQAMSFFAIALWLLGLSNRTMALPINWLKLGSCLFFALCAGIGMKSPWFVNPMISLLAKAPFLAVTYVLVILFIAPDWCRKATNFAIPLFRS